MRSLIYQALSSDVGLMALLPGGLTSGRSLETVPDAKPFGILTFEGPNPGIARVKQMRGTLWVHDEPGDYLLIDGVLKYVRDLLPALAPRRLGTVTLMEAEWNGDSPDLNDNERRTNMKNSVYLLTGSGL